MAEPGGASVRTPPENVARTNERIRGTFAGLLGMEFTSLAPDRVEATLQIREDLKQPWGIVHGGAVMTLADTVAGAASYLNAQGGQTVTVELDFSESGKSLVVSKGGFYNQTNGRWVYLVSDDRRAASRANIRTGRQNPRDVEVLEGLREGDWIITSGYDSFNEVDILVFPQPVDLGK